MSVCIYVTQFGSIYMIVCVCGADFRNLLYIYICNVHKLEFRWGGILWCGSHLLPHQRRFNEDHHHPPPPSPLSPSFTLIELVLLLEFSFHVSNDVRTWMEIAVRWFLYRTLLPKHPTSDCVVRARTPHSVNSIFSRFTYYKHHIQVILIIIFTLIN